MNFREKLTSATSRNKSFLCVGLDPDLERMPEGIGILDFNKAIIDATSDLVCAYKLNFAFYEVLETQGLDALKQTVKHIPDDIPVIADAKRGDIGNTARAYARAIFDNLNFDAVTVSPYLGFDSIKPFTSYRDKGVFILCRTSNPGAAEFQSMRCETEPPTGAGMEASRLLFELVALKAGQWNTSGNIGLVVGATYPEELKLVRSHQPDMLLLIPGIGAQGGDLAAAVRYGVSPGGGRIILNSSRQIIYASPEKDFAPAARRAAAELREQINHYLPAPL